MPRARMAVAITAKAVRSTERRWRSAIPPDDSGESSGKAELCDDAVVEHRRGAQPSTFRWHVRPARWCPCRGALLEKGIAMTTPSAEWDWAYRAPQPPWDIGRPQPTFVRLADGGLLSGRLLDAGCGTGEHVLLAAAHGAQAM